MKHFNYKDIDIPIEYKKLCKGGYVIKIIKVEDMPQKECLLIFYDIAEGYYKDYWQHKYERSNYWLGTFYLSYQDTDTARRFFKTFVNALELSNEGYTFNYDENSLVGLYMGVILIPQLRVKDGKNHYNMVVANDVCNSFKSVQAIRNNEYRVPEEMRKYGIKSYKPDYTKNGFMEKG